MTKFDWNAKNKNYDHQISLVMAKNNQLEHDINHMNKYLASTHKTEIQTQIDTTMKSVLGERKKYLKLLKAHSDTFYERLDQDR